MTLRVGVIGLGDVSMIHLHAIKSSEKAELVAVCDIDETKSSSIRLCAHMLTALPSLPCN